MGMGQCDIRKVMALIGMGQWDRDVIRGGRRGRDQAWRSTECWKEPPRSDAGLERGAAVVPVLGGQVLRGAGGRGMRAACLEQCPRRAPVPDAAADAAADAADAVAADGADGADGAAAAAAVGERNPPFYIYQLPIDRLSGCYW